MNDAKGEARPLLVTLFVLRPAVPAAALLIVGILSHAALPPRPLGWLVALGGLLVVTIAACRRTAAGGVASIALALALVVAGIAAAQVAAFYYPRDHISAFAGEQPRLGQIEVRIDEPPRVLYNPFDQRRPLPPKQVVTARVLRVKTWHGWVDSCGQVLVQIAQPHPRLVAGQTVRVLGMLQRPAPAMNPGQFDWAHYYREQRVLASISVAHANNIQILTEGRVGALTWAREKVRHLLAAGFPAERALDHALLRAMLLGDHDPQLRDVQDQFQRTGTSYHLSVSGMHVAVLACVMYGICRALCVSPRTSICMVTGFVLVYGLLALPSVPVVRSVLLCVAAGVGLLGGRSVDKVQLLALCVIGMLVYHPLDLYNAGFQLGFGTVLALVLFTRPVMDWLRTFRDPDMIVAEQFTRPTARRAAWRWLRRKLAFMAVAGGVAWVVSAPLIAYHFEQLNPWAIPAGVALGPIVFVALIGGLFKVVFTLLWPGQAAAWAWVATQPVALMRWVLSLLAGLPGADVPWPVPPVWVIVGFYALLCLPLLRCTWPRLRIGMRCGPVAACAMLGILPLLAGLPERPGEALRGDGELRVTLLSVGAGQCAVVEPPGGGAVLLDAGSDSLSDLLRKCLGPYLRHEGRREVASVFLSHGDYDHISAAGEVVTAYDVESVFVSPHFRRHAAESAPCESLLDELDRLGRSPRLVWGDGRVDLGGGAAVEVLWPPARCDLDSNNTGLVLRLTYAGKSILFPADIQEPAEWELLKTPQRLRSDVLIAPHHGSAEPTTADFVRAVDPAVVLSSNDRTLTNKQRNFESMIGARPLYRTNRCGAITVTVSKEGAVRVTPFLPRSP